MYIIALQFKKTYHTLPPDAGNSDNPCGNTYRGMRPASEIETENVQAEVLKIAREQQIESFVTIHTAAKMILTPWGSVLDPGSQQKCEFTKPEEHAEVVFIINTYTCIYIIIICTCILHF